MNTYTNQAEQPIEEFAVNLLGILGQYKDLKTEVSSLRDENQQQKQRIEILKQAYMMAFSDPVTQPG